MGFVQTLKPLRNKQRSKEDGWADGWMYSHLFFRQQPDVAGSVKGAIACPVTGPGPVFRMWFLFAMVGLASHLLFRRAFYQHIQHLDPRYDVSHLYPIS